HFFILSGSEEWRRFFFDETMVDALRRAGTDPLPEWTRRLGFREVTRRRNPFAATDPVGTPIPPATPSRLSPTPTAAPEPFFRRQLLADATPAAALALPPGIPAPGMRWARMATAPAPAAALRTASAYTITDFSARFTVAPPLFGVPFALQLAESDLFMQPHAAGSTGSTGFALLWDGATWRLQYRRAGVLSADVLLTHTPQENDGLLQAEVALEPRSAAVWIWRSGEPQPTQPNAVFAPPEDAALDGARARALFLPAHPITNLILEGATRYS
ncbi:MAG TPA: hypothetical protein VNM48_07815, partial [Chloroflexota bacterium]|nr:hypothetical protein [Chloroflexota bacterium]